MTAHAEVTGESMVCNGLLCRMYDQKKASAHLCHGEL